MNYVLSAIIGTFIIRILLSILVLLLGIKLLRNPKRKITKAVPIALMVVGIGVFLYSCVAVVLNRFHYAASSVSVIGGSDGPTSIFLAGNVGQSDMYLLIVGVLVLILGLYITLKRKIPFIRKYDGVKNKSIYCRRMGMGVCAEGCLLVIMGVCSLNPGGLAVIVVLGSILIALCTLVSVRKAI